MSNARYHALLADIAKNGQYADENMKPVREEVDVAIPRDQIRARVDKWVRSPSFEKVVDEIVRDHAKAVIVEVLAERDSELEAHVRRIVSARWEVEVDRVARAMLDQKLAELKRRLT